MTLQRAEKLIVNGDGYCLHSEPLSSYLKNIKPKVTLRQFTTRCYRGYVASWEISDDKLYLLKIETSETNKDQLQKIRIKLFPNAEERVLADWYSGSLICPNGEIIMKAGGCLTGIEHNNYLVMTVENGVVLDQHEKSLKDFTKWCDEHGRVVRSMYGH
jgi:hypothetical protein